MIGYEAYFTENGFQTDQFIASRKNSSRGKVGRRKKIKEETDLKRRCLIVDQIQTVPAFDGG